MAEVEKKKKVARRGNAVSKKKDLVRKESSKKDVTIK